MTTTTAPRQVRVRTTSGDLLRRAVLRLPERQQVALAALVEAIEHREPIIVDSHGAAAVEQVATLLLRATGTIPGPLLRLRAIATAGHFDPDPGPILAQLHRPENTVSTAALAHVLGAWAALADAAALRSATLGLAAEVENWRERMNSPNSWPLGQRLLEVCAAIGYRPSSTWPRATDLDDDEPADPPLRAVAPPRPPTSRMVPVTVDGQQFPTIASAAVSLGMNVVTLRAALRRHPEGVVVRGRWVRRAG